jgi:hypothetical protein
MQALPQAEARTRSQTPEIDLLPEEETDADL